MCLNDCTDKGDCSDDNICECYPLYKGEDCSEYWTDERSFNGVWHFYFIWTIIVNFVIAVYCVIQFYFLLHQLQGTINDRLKKLTNLVPIMYILITIGSIVRIIEFSVDPHGKNGTIPYAAEEITFNVPLILWFLAGMLLYLYWIEMQLATGITSSQNLRKMKPYFLAFTVVVAVVMPILVISYGLTRISFLDTLSIILYLVIFLLITSLVSYGGRKLLRTINNLWQMSNQAHYLMFLRKLTYYIFGMCIFLTCSMITLLIFLITNASTRPNLYIALHVLMRTEEFLVVGSTVLFLGKKKPSKSQTSTTKMSELDSRISLGEDLKGSIYIYNSNSNKEEEVSTST